jgi:signal transduction histidine kinase
MIDEFETIGDRRKRSDRRSGANRRSSKERRSSVGRRSLPDRRSGEDRRAGWGEIEDERLEGAVTTAATVAHLFSQPLTIIIGHVDLLLSNAQEEMTEKKLLIIKDQLKSLSMLLQDFRNLQEYNIIDFNGLTLLDIGLKKIKTYD